jgi:hypothetical protein
MLAILSGGFFLFYNVVSGVDRTRTAISMMASSALVNAACVFRVHLPTNSPSEQGRTPRKYVKSGKKHQNTK